MNDETSSAATPSTDQDGVADTLDAAADYLDEHGWCQGRSLKFTPTKSQPHPPACAFGAISRTAKGWRMIHYALNAFTVEVDGLLVSSWNDAPGREQWEVTDMLRTVAKKVRVGDIDVTS